jgi:hypothetical protein
MADDDLCTEPDGNERPEGERRTAHQLFMEEVGQCPWCGLTDDEERGKRK